MKIEKRDGSRESMILTAMIVSNEALNRIVPLWGINTLKTAQANIVGRLCVEYYSKYGQAPGKAIEGLVRFWGEKHQQAQQVEAVESLLSDLSDTYKHSDGINVQHVLDLFDKHTKEIRIRLMLELAQSALDMGQLDEADGCIQEYLSKQSNGIGEESDTYLINDDNTLSGVFDNSLGETLIHYPKPLDSFWGGAMQREQFVAFIAAEGVGKSFWLMDVAYRAVQQRRRVAFFEVGDMSKRQWITRWCVRMSGLPMRPGVVKYPYTIENGLAVCKPKKLTKKLDASIVLRARDDLVNKHIKSHNAYLHLSTHSIGGITMSGIEAVLKKLEVRDKWVPDVIIIDYADILAPPRGMKEPRDQINETWKQMRAMSMNWHCLLVTATQCNRDGYDAKAGLRPKHISEEKRKMSHVTDLIGINATDNERIHNTFRLNRLKGRDTPFSSTGSFIYVASCLGLGNPAVLSAFPENKKKNTKPG